MSDPTVSRGEPTPDVWPLLLALTTPERNAESSRRWRERHPDRQQLLKQMQHARVRAMRALAKRFPQEFAEELTRVMEELGIPEHLPPMPPEQSFRPSAACGTRSGYRRHLRNGERTCDRCRKAHTAHQLAWRRTRREREEQ